MSQSNLKSIFSAPANIGGYYFMYMGKPQTFDIIAVSIPDSNVQKAVARIMVGADRYLSMQAALDQVKAPPVLLFKNTELKDAEQHIAKLKALGVGFRVVRSDGSEDDSVMRDDELPAGAAAHVGKGGKGQPSADAQALSEILTPGNAPGATPPIVSVRDAISNHHREPRGAPAGGVSGFGSAGGYYGGAGGGSGLAIFFLLFMPFLLRICALRSCIS